MLVSLLPWYVVCAQQEKYLHVRPEFVPSGGLTRPPGGERASYSSVSSMEDVTPSRGPPTRQDSLSQLLNKRTSRTSQASVSDLPKSPDYDDMVDSSTQFGTASSVSNPPRSATTSSKDPVPQSSSTLLDDFGKDNLGSSLMSDLSSFGDIMDSYGLGGSSLATAPSGVKKPTPVSSTSKNSVTADKPPGPSAVTSASRDPYKSIYEGVYDECYSFHCGGDRRQI